MRVPSIAARPRSAAGLVPPAALGLLFCTVLAAPRAQTPASKPTANPKPGAQTQAVERVASEETPAADEDHVRNFLDAMRSAHWGETKPFAIDRYVATLRIEPKKTMVEEHGTRAKTDLAILYLNGEGKARDLIRYRIEYEGNKIQRGVDTDGPWFLDKDGKTRALDEFKEQAEQRRELQRHRRAASMLGKLLDPSAGLDGLTAKKPAEKTKFAFGPGGIPAEVLRGHMERFPLWQAPKNSDPKLGVDVELWREERTGRLFAVEVFPLRRVEGPMPEGQGAAKTVRTGVSEVILLRNYEPKSGLQIPTQLFVFARDPKATKPLVNQVNLGIREIDLRPDLTEARFQRPKG